MATETHTPFVDLLTLSEADLPRKLAIPYWIDIDSIRVFIEDPDSSSSDEGSESEGYTSYGSDSDDFSSDGISVSSGTTISDNSITSGSSVDDEGDIHMED